MTTFEERQYVRSSKLWSALLLAGVSMCSFGIFQSIAHGLFWDDPSAPHFLFGSLNALVAGFSALLYGWGNLSVIVNSDQIQLRFFPFHFASRVFSTDEIEGVASASYDALREFGGWGIRSVANGQAYTVNGKGAVILHLKNGRKFLIGTQAPDALENSIKQLLNSVDPRRR